MALPGAPARLRLERASRRPAAAGLCVVAATVVACGAAGVAEPPPSTPGASADEAPSLAPEPAVSIGEPIASAAPAVSSSPSASAPSAPLALPAWFERGASLTFRVRDSVDTHDPEARGPARTSAVVTMTVTEISSSGAEWSATAAWKLPDELSWLSLPDRWVLRDGVLAIDGDEGWRFDASKLARSRRPACHDEEGEGMYGPTHRRLCVDGRGLVSLREVNRAGPRVLEVVRAGPR